MLWMLLLGGLYGPPAPKLDNLPACKAEERPFSLIDERADWFWGSDRIAIGQVVSIHWGRPDGRVWWSPTTPGTYRVRILKRLKGSGPWPRGTFERTDTDDGQVFGKDPPPVGQIQVFSEDKTGGGWLPAGEVRCLPIPPA